LEVVERSCDCHELTSREMPSVSYGIAGLGLLHHTCGHSTPTKAVSLIPPYLLILVTRVGCSRRFLPGVRVSS
jgi:hypothetical protein